MRQALLIAALGLALTSLTPVQAQSRADRIEQARNQFSDSLALELLMPAANPGAPTADSLWVVSVHELALRLLGGPQPALAPAWLRLSARHGARWAIDPAFFPPTLVQAYEQAASEVRATAEPVDGVATTWRWPSGFSASAAGTLEIISSDPRVQLSVTVTGRGPVQGGSSSTLPAGSYDLLASAAGYEPVQVTREVLPGAATVLEFDLKPLLPPDVEVSAAGSLVMIRAAADAATCTTGSVARPGGLVLTTLTALPANEGLEVVDAAGRVYRNVSVAASDQAANLAVLRLDGAVTTQPRAATAAANQYVWSVYRPQCGPATSSRSRLAAGAPTVFAPALPAGAVGAPLIDATGAMLGVVTGLTSFIPLAAADALLARATPPIVVVAQPAQVPARRGGFPFLWVGAGAVVAGLGAVLLGGGGGGDGGPSGDGDTGVIVITIPGSN